MATAAERPARDYLAVIAHLPPGGTLSFQRVPWSEYEKLLEALGPGYSPRVYYDRGHLEVSMPLAKHEEHKDMLLGFARIIAEEFELDMQSYGSTTYRLEAAQQGIEPATCFYVQNARRVFGRERFDLSVDPPPAVAVEVDITSESLRRFPIYATLGVPEIWRYDEQQLTLYHLIGQEYQVVEHSRAFPFLTGAVLAEALERSKTGGQSAALRAFRQWVKTQHTPQP